MWLLRGTSWIFVSPFAAPTVPAASYYRSSARTELFSLRLRKSELNFWTVSCQQSYFLLSLWYEKPAGIPDSTTALMEALCCCFHSCCSRPDVSSFPLSVVLCAADTCHLPGKCQLCHLNAPNFLVYDAVVSDAANGAIVRAAATVRAQSS